MSAYYPENYFEALGALKATRDEVRSEKESADRFRARIEARARELETKGRACRKAGCDDWIPTLRAAMELWILLGDHYRWTIIHREIPIECGIHHATGEER